jgi:hypothetical protein
MDLNICFPVLLLLGMFYYAITSVYDDLSGNKDRREKEDYKSRARNREKNLDYENAIWNWEEAGEDGEAARVRKLQAEMGSVKVSQKVVHGDEVTKTEIKDSVVSKSNVSAGGKSKSEELREAKALLDDGIIDDDEFKQMKKKILGK